MRDGGVIWISGYSSAGKSTVSRLVVASLRSQNRSVILLDGDDLRSIFSAKWGYEKEDRIELARVYFKLCSHLSSQGHIVVIAAVALYNDISHWLEENVPGVLSVFLDVPEPERRRRDAKGKNIYPKVGDLTSLYDGPNESSLKLQSYGSETPQKLAERILHAFNAHETVNVTYGRNEHWSKYYASLKAPSSPSSFAILVESEFAPASKVLEVGCGNGRDSAFFANQGHHVIACDASQAAVELAQNSYPKLPILFFVGALPQYQKQLELLDVIYSRFVLHAMPLHEELETLASAFTVLREGGHIYIECRSINDPMARLGEVISPTERIHGHYRRFIIKDELIDRLIMTGFTVLSIDEHDGLAVHGDDNPV